MNEKTESELITLADHIDDATCNECEIRSAAKQTVRALDEGNHEAYKECTELFDARLNHYQKTYEKVIGCINRFSQKLLEAAEADGFIKRQPPPPPEQPLPTAQEKAPEGEPSSAKKSEAKSEVCPECKAESEAGTKEENSTSKEACQ